LAEDPDVDVRAVASYALMEKAINWRGRPDDLELMVTGLAKALATEEDGRIRDDAKVGIAEALGCTDTRGSAETHARLCTIVRAHADSAPELEDGTTGWEFLRSLTEPPGAR